MHPSQIAHTHAQREASARVLHRRPSPESGGLSRPVARPSLMEPPPLIHGFARARSNRAVARP